jgi:hypothetical protein
MKRPNLATLAGVNPACQRFRLTGQDHLTVRKGYGQDHLRLLRCRTCGEECSERRGTALCNITITEERAAFVVNWTRDVGCGPPSAWSTSPKTRSCASSGERGAMPSGAMTHGCATSPHALWRWMTRGAS